jgi:hypothetical protein
VASILKELPDGIMLVNHSRPVYLNKRAIELMQLEEKGIKPENFIETLKD